jgi:predicted DNA-binding transcriptional regulator AlpA
MKTKHQKLSGNKATSRSTFHGQSQNGKWRVIVNGEKAVVIAVVYEIVPDEKTGGKPWKRRLFGTTPGYQAGADGEMSFIATCMATQKRYRIIGQLTYCPRPSAASRSQAPTAQPVPAKPADASMAQPPAVTAGSAASPASPASLQCETSSLCLGVGDGNTLSSAGVPVGQNDAGTVGANAPLPETAPIASPLALSAPPELPCTVPGSFPNQPHSLGLGETPIQTSVAASPPAGDSDEGIALKGKQKKGKQKKAKRSASAANRLDDEMATVTVMRAAGQDHDLKMHVVSLLVKLSRPSIYRHIALGKFPAQKKRGRSSFWSLVAIDLYRAGKWTPGPSQDADTD